MQKKTIFLFFAIGLLVFVDAIPMRKSTSSSGSAFSGDDFQPVRNNNNVANKNALKYEWERNPDNYEITDKGLKIKLNRVENGNIREDGTYTQRWSPNFYKNHVKKYDAESIDRNVAVNTLFSKNNLIQLWVNRQTENGSHKQGGPVRLN